MVESSTRVTGTLTLLQYGFQVVIAPSFGDIFYNNCLKNGLLLIKLDPKIVDRLFKETQANEGYRLGVDLESQTLTTPSGESFRFDVDPFRKHCVMNGLDEIGLTLEHADQIKAFEALHRSRRPWLLT
jgi:3-isopropylmalate/(R)-2-methylmalate dehydratase small subunit